MEYFTNEHQVHPLTYRVEVLERLLDEAINIISAKARPGDECLLGGWLDEAIAILNSNEWEDE